MRADRELFLVMHDLLCALELLLADLSVVVQISSRNFADVQGPVMVHIQLVEHLYVCADVDTSDSEHTRLHITMLSVQTFKVVRHLVCVRCT